MAAFRLEPWSFDAPPGGSRELGGLQGLSDYAYSAIFGGLADRVGRKLLVALASVFAVASLAIYLLAGLTWNWLLLIPGVLVLGLVAISGPAIGTMAAEATGSGERGAAYGTIMFSFYPSWNLCPPSGRLGSR